MEGRGLDSHSRSQQCDDKNERFSHGNSVLKRLNEQRKEGKVCDVILTTQGKEFPAHICVLVTYSKYFEALHAERNISFHDAQKVNLPELTVGALQQVLEYVYTGRLYLSGPVVVRPASPDPSPAGRTDGELACDLDSKMPAAVTADDIKALLHAADYLIMDELKDEVRKSLLSTVNVENCIDYMITAYIYCLQEVYEAARGIVMARLGDYLQHSSELCTIHPDEIELILGDKKLKEVLRPSTLLELLAQWVFYERRAREVLLEDRLFPNIIVDSLRRQAGSDMNAIGAKMLNHELVATSKKCRAHLSELLSPQPQGSSSGFCRTSNTLGLVEESDGPPKKRTKVESTEDLPREPAGEAVDMVDIIVINGFEDQQTNLAYLVQDDQWLSLPDLPEKRKNHGMVQHGNKLFIVGGCQRGYIPQEHCLNLETMTWSTLPPTPRTHVHVQALVSHGKRLYVMGDRGTDRYDLDEQRWAVVAPPQRNTAFLSPPKQIMKAASHGDHIYTCTSFKFDLFGSFFATEAQLHRYDPVSTSWEQLQGPVDEENNPIPITHGHALYSVAHELVLADPANLRMAYHYDPDNRQWTCHSSAVPAFDSKPDLFSCIGCVWLGGAAFFRGHKFVADWSETYVHLTRPCPHERCKWEWRSPPPFVTKAQALPMTCHMRIPRSLLSERPIAQYLYTQG